MPRIVNINTNQELTIEYTENVNGNKLYKVEPLNNDSKLIRWVYMIYDYTVAIFHNDGYYYYEIYYKDERVFISNGLYENDYKLSDVISIADNDVINLKNNNKKIINFLFSIKKDDCFFLNYKNYDEAEAKVNALIKLDIDDLTLLRRLLHNTYEDWYKSYELSKDEGALEAFDRYQDLYFETYLFKESNENSVTLEYNYDEMSEIIGLLDYETNIIIEDQKELEKYLEELDSIYLKFYLAYKERKKYVSPIVSIID